MARPQTLRLTISDPGQRLMPDTLDVRDFTDIVVPLREAIALVAADTDDVTQMPAGTEPILCIQGTEEGSCVVNLIVPEKSQLAARRVVQAIKTRSFDDV